MNVQNCVSVLINNRYMFSVLFAQIYIFQIRLPFALKFLCEYRATVLGLMFSQLFRRQCE
jgi:hypothetical protein